MTQHDRPGELCDLAAHTRLLTLGAQALVALGNITQPDSTPADEELSGTRRSQIATVFSFFGEVLRESSEVAEEAVHRLDGRLREIQETAFYKGLTQRVAKEIATRSEER